MSQITVARRSMLAESIRKMIEGGATEAAVAATLHVSRNTVAKVLGPDYSRASRAQDFGRRVLAGLNAGLSAREIAEAEGCQIGRVRGFLHRLRRGSGSVPVEEIAQVEDADLLTELRPSRRSQCRAGLRPCPWVGCQWHLYLDVNPETGALKINFPGLEVWELEETCALDVIEQGGDLTLEDVGQYFDLTRERIRQIAAMAMVEVRHKFEVLERRDSRRCG